MSLHVIEHPVFEHVVDLAPKGDSQGDQFPFSNPLFDASDTQQVGRDQGNCIRTNPRRGEWQCSWTNKLPHGQITVEGPFYDNRDSLLSIIGGTGAYREARGQMLLHARSDGYDFVFSLIQQWQPAGLKHSNPYEVCGGHPHDYVELVGVEDPTLRI